MSLIEIMISAGLLLVISTVLFMVLVPTLGNSARLDEKQENLQKAVVLRHHLTSRLRGAQILQVQPGFVEFYVPDQVGTPRGTLTRIGTDEMPMYDQSVSLEVTTEVRPEGTWVVEQRRGQPATARGIWNLGVGGTLAFANNPPLVNVTVTGTSGRLSAGTWTKSFDLVLPNVP